MQDIDECSLDRFMCAGECKNTIGSYTCMCPDGYELYNDATSCMGKPKQLL